MPSLSPFRQNAVQLCLLLSGCIGTVLISIWTAQVAYANESAQFYHLFAAPLIQLFNFLGFHFLVSWIYRRIPWRKAASLVLILEAFLLFFPLIAEAFLLQTYHSNYNYYYGIVVLATNYLEVSEYIVSTFLSKLILLGIVLVVLAIAVSFLVKWLYRLADKSRWFRNIIHPSRGFVLISGLVFAVCTTFNLYNTLHAESKLPLLSSNSSDRFVWCTLMAANERRVLEHHLNNMQSPAHLQGFTYRPTTKTPIQVVIILGESAQAGLMSAYGYERATTPWLKAAADSGNVVVFNDACSAANITITSCQRVLTYWNSDPHKQWYDFPELTFLMKKAGFATKWFTNQSMDNRYSIEKLLGRAADTIYSTMSQEESKEDISLLDENLLPMLVQHNSTALLRDNHRSSFELIHLAGSHQGYAQRYPPTFDYFKPSQMTECLTDDAKRQKAAYLNSLRYTDHLLEKMIAHYKNQRALVFYFSDHGEMVDEPQQRGFFGHGGNVDHPSVDVPFFVYASPQLRAEHPELWTRIQKAQFRPISTAWFTNSLTSLLGIHTKYNDERYNFFSDSFSNPTRIAVQGDTRHVIPPIKKRRVNPASR